MLAMSDPDAMVEVSGQSEPGMWKNSLCRSQTETMCPEAWWSQTFKVGDARTGIRSIIHSLTGFSFERHLLLRVRSGVACAMCSIFAFFALPQRDGIFKVGDARNGILSEHHIVIVFRLGGHQILPVRSVLV